MQRAAAGTASSLEVKSMSRDARASQMAGQAVTTSPISAATPAMLVLTCGSNDVDAGTYHTYASTHVLHHTDRP